MGDQIVCEHLSHPYGPPKYAMVTLANMKEYVSWQHHVPGLKKARAALELIRVGVDSPKETELRLVLQRAGMPTFVPDHAIRNESDVPLRWADLGCEESKASVQYEGEHHLTPKQQSSDNARDYEIAESGWHRAKINKEDMKDGARLAIRKVAQMMVRGGWPAPDNLAGDPGRAVRR